MASAMAKKESKEKKSSQRFENSVYMNLWFLRMSGWWNDVKWSNILRLLYFSYTCFVIFCHLVMLITVSVNMLVERKEIIVVMDDMNILLVGLTNSAKIFPFVFSRSKVQRCLRLLSRMQACGEATVERHTREEHSRRFTLRVSWILIVLCMTSCTTWVAVVPFFTSGSKSLSAVTNGSTMEETDDEETVHRPLPLQGWMPFNMESSPGWEVAYILMSVATCIDSWIACHTNGIYFAFMYFSYTQFDALCTNLREIRVGAHKRACDVNGGEEDERRLSLTAQQRHIATQMEMSKALRQAVLHHQAILSFVDSLEDILGPVMFTECVAMSMMLCCVVFQAALVTLVSSKFLALMLFLVFEMLELLCFCWAGTLIILQSQAVSNAAFDCGWEDSAPAMKSSLHFVLLRGQKPSRVTALGFSTLSLQLFAALLRASYSYYAVLRQANDTE